MTHRERFIKTVHFESVDRPPLWEFGYGDQTIARWRKEGLPGDANPIQFFGLDSVTYFEPVHSAIPHFFKNLNPVPAFHKEILEETEEHVVWIDEDGVTKRESRENGSTQWLKFPIENSRDWQEFKTRLDPNSPIRYPSDWENLKEAWKHRDYPLVIYVGSFYGLLRNWIGMEKFSLMFCEEPKLVEEMMEYLTHFFLGCIRKALKEITFDHAHFWEDMAFKSGPLISPAMFRKFMLPHYRKIVELVRSYGVDVISVDCDGKVDQLIPLWLDVGINGVLPCEAAAGMDVVTLRKAYGKNLWLAGGIDKRVLTRGRIEIEREVVGKVPGLVSKGGYIPTVDHEVPSDVPLENYLFYLKVLKKCLEQR